MNHSVLTYLKKIEDRQKEIDEAQLFIDEETKKHNQIIAPKQEIIENQRQEISEIKDIEVSAELKDIIYEIAKEWNTSADKISTKCFTCFIHTPTKGKRIFNGVKELSGYYLLNFSMSTKENSLHYTTFSTKIDSSEVQLDGNPINKHLSFAGVGSQGSKLKKLNQDEISKFIIKFKMGDLIDNKGKVKQTGCASQILNACELYSKKHSTPTM